MSSYKILINAIRCLGCKAVVVSKYRHDFVACSCGNGADGGNEYLRRVGDIEHMQELSVVELPSGQVVLASSL